MKLKQYQKYRNSGVQWIGKIPEDWDVFRFKIKFKYSKGRIPSTLEETNGNGSLPYLSMEYLRGKEDAQILFSPKDPSATYVKDNELLLLWDGSNAGEFVIGKEGYLSSTMVKLSPQGIKKEYSKYLCFAFEKILRDLTIGMGIPHVNSDHLDNIRVAIPTDKEQEIISEYLNKKIPEIDLLIEKDKSLIELLKERRITLINHAVTKGLNPKVKLVRSGVEWIGNIPEHWEVRRIKTLSYVKRGASPRPIDDLKYFDDNGEYAWVRIEDVTASNKYLIQTYEKLSLLGKSLSVPLEPGEIFLSIAGSVGKPIITKIKCCIHDGFVYFQRLKINSEYLYYIFTGKEVYKGLGKLGTQLNLNTDTVGDIRIPHPPKSEQIQIADFLDKATAKIDLTISKIESKIELLEEYKKSIIHNVVTGKVDVRA